MVSDAIETTFKLLKEVLASRAHASYLNLMQQWKDDDRRDHIQRVTSSENIRKGQLLIQSFERVTRAEASSHAIVRAVFQRAFGFTNHEAGWLMKELGLKAAVNSKRISVAYLGPHGLKIRTTRGSCIECPLCGYYIPHHDSAHSNTPETETGLCH